MRLGLPTQYPLPRTMMMIMITTTKIAVITPETSHIILLILSSLDPVGSSAILISPGSRPPYPDIMDLRSQTCDPIP